MSANPYAPPLSALNPRARATEPDGLTPRKLAWYEQAWAMLPLVLIAVGGAIGGACGGLAWALNQKVFRSVRVPILRYLASGLISLGAVVVWLMIALILGLLTGQIILDPEGVPVMAPGSGPG